MSKLSNRSRRASSTRLGRRAALYLAVLALALHPGPATTGGFFDGIWARLRFLWVEAGVQIDPSGQPGLVCAAEGPASVSRIWADEGVEIDPSGRTVPAHVTTPSPSEQQ